VIGVIANPPESPVVREFFELFKTPWEFYGSGRQYDVLLCVGDCSFDPNAAKVVLLYGGHKLSFDEEAKIRITSESKAPRTVSCNDRSIPIYGESVTFAGETGVITGEGFQKPAGPGSGPGAHISRIGYNLFDEVRTLLTSGQPRENAGIPTLELHISLLRELIVTGGVQLLEIPPVPAGYRMIACLTHDVDHPSIRLHRFDHTMFGFLYRAIVGSVADFVQGRVSAANLFRNWLAALKLPLVHAGLAKDFWVGFDRYTEIEGGSPSSFFIIPFKNRPGRTADGVGPRIRGAAYGAADVAPQVGALLSAGCEIGLHGIDAWIDPATGSEELNEIRSVTGKNDVGVRMHWLFFDDRSPAVLEKAGASYDSSVGYNETIGYRSGSGQAYKPLNADTVLELPMLIMDTALFYPAHLHLSPEDAQARINAIIANAARDGGCVTVNWHDRSIAPERLWTDTYVSLIKTLREQRAWFATASQATLWFRTRRAVKFQGTPLGGIEPVFAGKANDALPQLILRTHCASGSSDITLQP